MKRLIFTLLASVCILSLAACGDTGSNTASSEAAASSQQQAEQSSAESKAEPTQSDADTSSEQDKTAPDSTAQPDTSATDTSGDKDTIVIYFSATGTTKGVAQRIASAANADTYEIVPQEKYTDADLDWNDKTSRSTVEMNDPDSRPKIAGDLPDLSAYKRVFIGYPIWWNEAPRIINTFVEKEGLKGVTVIPFATSGGSGIDYSVRQLKAAYSAVGWREGRLLNAETDKEIQAWAKQALAAAKK